MAIATKLPITDYTMRGLETFSDLSSQSHAHYKCDLSVSITLYNKNVKSRLKHFRMLNKIVHLS